jgi:putative transposase
MFVAENFIRSLVDKYGRHTVYTDGGTWYPQACNFLYLKHRMHYSLEKSLIERVMQYFKDRTECFDDYYPFIVTLKNNNCDLQMYTIG